MKCPDCDVEMFYVASLTLGKQSWANRNELDECPQCAKKIKRKKKVKK